MMWEALGGLILAVVMLGFALWAFYRAGVAAGRELVRQEAAERRAVRRAEVRAQAGRHRLQPFPDLEQHERPADTGELRALAEAAETGDLAEIGRQNAAFFRRLDLRRWVRAA